MGATMANIAAQRTRLYLVADSELLNIRYPLLVNCSWTRQSIRAIVAESRRYLGGLAKVKGR